MRMLKLFPTEADLLGQRCEIASPRLRSRLRSSSQCDIVSPTFGDIPLCSRPLRTFGYSFSFIPHQVKPMPFGKAPPCGVVSPISCGHSTSLRPV